MRPATSPAKAISGFSLGSGRLAQFDGVLEGGGDGGVVLRAGDEEAVGVDHEALELPGAGREAGGGFEIAVVDGEFEFAEVQERDLGAGFAGAVGGEADEFLVEGVLAEGAGEGEELGGRGGWWP
jgi:hypothetical protein